MAKFGDFAGGLAQGIQSGFNMRAQRQTMALQQQQLEAQERARQAKQDDIDFNKRVDLFKLTQELKSPAARKRAFNAFADDFADLNIDISDFDDDRIDLVGNAIIKVRDNIKKGLIDKRTGAEQLAFIAAEQPLEEAERERVTGLEESLLAQAPGEEIALAEQVRQFGVAQPEAFVAGGGEQARFELLARSEEGRKVLEAEAEERTKAEEGIDPTQSNALRKQFLDLSKPFRDVRDSYARIQASGKNPSPAGDLSLIFNYMKMLDPRSVVRESEFATAQNSAGVPEKIRRLYNKVISGERLGVGQRKDFMSRADSLFKKQSAQHKKREDVYRKLATDSDVDPKLVVIDIRSPSSGTQGSLKEKYGLE